MTEVNFGTSTNTVGGSFISCLLGRFSGQFSSHRFWGTAVDECSITSVKDDCRLKWCQSPQKFIELLQKSHSQNMLSSKYLSACTCTSI